MFICRTIKQEVREDYTVLNIALIRILESFDLGIALLIYNPHAHYIVISGLYYTVIPSTLM